MPYQLAQDSTGQPHQLSDRFHVARASCRNRSTYGHRQDGVEEYAGRVSDDYGAAPSVYDEPQFCALSTELRHTIGEPVFTDSLHLGRIQTGAPMFMSVELSDYQGMRYEIGMAMRKLVPALTEIEKLVQGCLHLQLASLKHDKAFMPNFNAVLAIETERITPRVLAFRPFHRPRHDLESLFWAFLWVVARARPLNPTEAQDERDIDYLTQFCDAMLRQIISDTAADRRSIFLEHRGHFHGLFHPDISPIDDLFENMACYLSIPWHYYERLNMVEVNNAHVAFSRMILHFLLTADQKILDMPFDTGRPRDVNFFVGYNMKERVGSLQASSVTHFASSDTV